MGEPRDLPRWMRGPWRLCRRQRTVGRRRAFSGLGDGSGGLRAEVALPTSEVRDLGRTDRGVGLAQKARHAVTALELDGAETQRSHHVREEGTELDARHLPDLGLD